MRRTIRDMPYRRRHEGLTVGEIYVLKQILRFIPDLIEMSGNLPECPLKAFCQLLLYALFVILLAQLIVERHDVVPIVVIHGTYVPSVPPYRTYVLVYVW